MRAVCARPSVWEWTKKTRATCQEACSASAGTTAFPIPTSCRDMGTHMLSPAFESNLAVTRLVSELHRSPFSEKRETTALSSVDVYRPRLSGVQIHTNDRNAPSIPSPVKLLADFGSSSAASASKQVPSGAAAPRIRKPKGSGRYPAHRCDMSKHVWSLRNVKEA